MSNELISNPARDFFENQNLPEGVCTEYLGLINNHSSLGKYVISFSDPKMPLQIVGLEHEQVTMEDQFGREYCEKAMGKGSDWAEEMMEQLGCSFDELVDRTANQVIAYELSLELKSDVPIAAYHFEMDVRDAFGDLFDTMYSSKQVFDFNTNDLKGLSVKFGFNVSDKFCAEHSDKFGLLLLDEKAMAHIVMPRITQVRTVDGGFYYMSPDYRNNVYNWCFGIPNCLDGDNVDGGN